MSLEQMKEEIAKIDQQMQIYDLAVLLIDNNIPFFKELFTSEDVEETYTLEYDHHALTMEIEKHTSYEGDLLRLDFTFSYPDSGYDSRVAEVEIDEADIYTGKQYLTTVSKLIHNILRAKAALEAQKNTLNRRIQLHGKSAVEADILNRGYSSDGFRIWKEGNDRLCVELYQAYVRLPLLGHGGTLQASMQGINLLELKLKQAIVDLQKLRDTIQEEVDKKDV